MKKKLIFSSIFSITVIVGLVLSAHPAFAQITNPVIGKLGTDSVAAQNGSLFTGYFVTLWRVVIFLGVLALLFNFINGALEWILAGGESGKIQKGRDKIVQSVIGMIVLALSFIIISFVSQLFFNFDLLNLPIPKVNSATSNTCDTSTVTCSAGLTPYCVNGVAAGCH